MIIRNSAFEKRNVNICGVLHHINLNPRRLIANHINFILQLVVFRNAFIGGADGIQQRIENPPGKSGFIIAHSLYKDGVRICIDYVVCVDCPELPFNPGSFRDCGVSGGLYCFVCQIEVFRIGQTHLKTVNNRYRKYLQRIRSRGDFRCLKIKFCGFQRGSEVVFKKPFIALHDNSTSLQHQLYLVRLHSSRSPHP